jgi:hypothetical protein
MTSLFLIIILLSFFLVLLFLLFFYQKLKKSSTKKTIISSFCKPFLKEQEFNPDISTNNWDLHKLRLEKFRRSQYKGLTFFVSSENKIYYLSEEGNKVYC